MTNGLRWSKQQVLLFDKCRPYDPMLLNLSGRYLQGPPALKNKISIISSSASVDIATHKKFKQCHRKTIHLLLLNIAEVKSFCWNLHTKSIFFSAQQCRNPAFKSWVGCPTVLTLKGMIFKFASVRIFLTAIEKALNDINLTTRLLSWLGQAKAIIKVLIFEQPLTTLWHGVVS